ncbi:CRISPR-associated endonuclease Cas1 [Jannaschia seosinensis]|uniref:CRISPR-associated endonuclease Cas1 n=2 Tax=Jannaschia seosinensis TaxID=313367 RepID=A0A0M7BC65_9RHOB|nr:CRISPR-associated endonuclease Cas1 [Jannaschia seosinensis]
MKQAWKKVVVAKIEMQAAALLSLGKAAAPLRMMIRSVTSGDTTNIEAQAARYYWPHMMGPEFRRDAGAGGLNALLNYGYTVLRAATARAVVAAGLHPSIGLHHSNRCNAFALADDLMEPFRLLADCAARRIAQDRGDAVDFDAKLVLARLTRIIHEKARLHDTAVFGVAETGKTDSSGGLDLAKGTVP